MARQGNLLRHQKNGRDNPCLVRVEAKLHLCAVEEAISFYAVLQAQIALSRSCPDNCYPVPCKYHRIASASSLREGDLEQSVSVYGTKKDTMVEAGSVRRVA